MRRFCLVIAAMSLVGCTSYTPPVVREITKSVEISSSAESVWQSVIRYFGEANVPIENMDHSSYFIKTKPVGLLQSFARGYSGTELPLRNQWCDCGDATIGNVWTSTQRFAVSFNIILKPVSPTSTLSTVNVFFDGVKLGKRSAYAAGYDIDMPLTCVSTGKLEADLLRYLRETSVRQ